MRSALRADARLAERLRFGARHRHDAGHRHADAGQGHRVTLTLPVSRGVGSTAQVVVSYGACSSATCLEPVIDEAIPVSVP